MRNGYQSGTSTSSGKLEVQEPDNYCGKGWLDLFRLLRKMVAGRVVGIAMEADEDSVQGKVENIARLRK